MDAPTAAASPAQLASPVELALAEGLALAGELGLAAESAVTAEAAAIVAAIDDIPVLDDKQRAILDFERQWWKRAGAKEQAIRDTFAMSPTRYYQTLNTLLELPGALSYDPSLVHRLQRLRSSAMRSRHLR